MAVDVEMLRKPPATLPDSAAHRRQIVDYLRPLGDRASQVLPKDGSESMANPLPLAQFTEATPSDTRPAAADWEGALIYASDTQKVQVSDGATWLNLH